MLEKAALYLLGKGAEVVGNKVAEHLPPEVKEKISGATNTVTDAIGLTSHSTAPQTIDARYSDFSYQPFSKIYTNNPLQLANANLHNANLVYCYCDEFTHISGIDLKGAKLNGAILLLAHTIEEGQRVFGRQVIEPLLPENHKAILTLKDVHQWLKTYLKKESLQEPELHHAGLLIATGYYFIQSKLNLRLECSPQEFQKDIETFRLTNRKLIEKYPDLLPFKQHFRNYIDPLPIVTKHCDIELIDNNYMDLQEERVLHSRIEDLLKHERGFQKKIEVETLNLEILKQQEKQKTLQLLKHPSNDLNQSVLGSKSLYMESLDVSIIDLQNSTFLPPEQLNIQRTLSTLEQVREKATYEAEKLQKQLQSIIKQKVALKKDNANPLNPENFRAEKNQEGKSGFFL